MLNRRRFFALIPAAPIAAVALANAAPDARIWHVPAYCETGIAVFEIPQYDMVYRAFLRIGLLATHGLAAQR